jgi:nicotinamide-nucleotide amidase
MIAKSLTDFPGSSAYFLGGVVAYSNSVKEHRLGVPAEVLAVEGAVSQAVAAAMARGVARAFGADAGIGVTGVAGPGGGTAEKPLGTVWYSVYLDGEEESRTTRFLGDRQDVRSRATAAALLLLLRRVQARSP